MTDTFGAHVKRLREVRRLTQEELAERSGLATDTIRRLEHQDFSPSLRTLRKVCKGLEISVSAMFNSYELDELPEAISRIMTALIGRSPAQLKLVERCVSTLLEELDEHFGPEPEPEPEPAAAPAKQLPTAQPTGSPVGSSAGPLDAPALPPTAAPEDVPPEPSEEVTILTEGEPPPDPSPT